MIFQKPSLTSLSNESDVEQKFLYPLLISELPGGLNYDVAEVQTKASIRKFQIGKGESGKSYFPDYIIARGGIPLLVAEAKSPRSNLTEAFREARLYASEMNALFPTGIQPVKRIMVTDGVSLVAGWADQSDALYQIPFDQIDIHSALFADFNRNFGSVALDKAYAEIMPKIRPRRYWKPRKMVGGVAIQREEVGMNSFGATIYADFSYILALSPGKIENLSRKTHIPDVYEALDVVSRELVGLIPAVSRDATVERAAVGQNVTAFKSRAAVATDITPGVTPPDDGDQTFDNFKMTITKARRVPFRWNGEQARGLNNGGPGVKAMMIDQISQAVRTLTNEMESDLAGTCVAASRAYGTATTLPFASTASAGTDSAQLKKLLDDNGAPPSDRQLVVSTGGGANLRSHAQLQKLNETAAPDFLRQGTLIDMNSFAIRESAQIKRPAIGTGASYLVNGALAAGATAVVIDGGSGTVLAGDVVTFAGDTNKYVVAIALTAGTVTLAAPGLRGAVADNAAMTIVAISTRDMAFRRSAIILAARLPALVDGEDMAVERSLVQDPLSGFAFEIAKYQQYRQTQWEISAAWGVGVPKPEHFAILLGE